jgi:hypothetical protein
MLPVIMALALVGILLDNGRHDERLRSVGVLVVVSLLSGLVSPIGLQGLLLPLQIRGAAKSVISEWQLTALFASPGFLLLVAAGLALFLLGRVRGARSEILFTAAVLLFGLMAVRNVAPAVLLLTPLLTSLIDRAMGRRRRVVVSQGERRRLRVAAGIVAILGVVSLPIAVLAQDQGPPKYLPIGLVDQLSEQPGQIRLLNDYNVAGVALFYGGDDVQVAVDGRTDFFGRDYLERYQDAILYGRDLDKLIADLQPTHALLQNKSGAATLLEAEGWRVLGSTDDYVLLTPP